MSSCRTMRARPAPSAVRMASSRSRDAARQHAIASRLAASTDAKVAYYVWARAKLQVVVARQAVEQAKSHVSDVQKSLAADGAPVALTSSAAAT